MRVLMNERRADTDMLTTFEDTTLPFEEWTHAAHVRVAYLYCRQYRFAEALTRIRQGIQSYNQAQDVPDTPTRGYHETITVAFVTLVADALARHGDPGSSQAFMDAHPDLLDKRVLERYYSRELLYSPAAKRTYVGPDVQDLP